MILSISFEGNNLCSVSYLLKYFVRTNSFIGYPLLKSKVKSIHFYNFKKFGKWIPNYYFHILDYLFIYSCRDKIIFKNIRFDNRLEVGDFNNYCHQLIFKSEL